jgi:hypothetical protein
VTGLNAHVTREMKDALGVNARWLHEAPVIFGSPVAFRGVPGMSGDLAHDQSSGGVDPSVVR